jgi:hypothetical protein
MKGGTFLSKRDYAEMETKIETDYESIISSGPYIEKSYQHITDKKEREEYELQYKAIICMLSHTKQIECITVSSRYGFIFHIKSSKSYFKKLDTDGTTEIEVYDILLKLSIITDKEEDYIFEELKERENVSRDKNTQTISEILKEARTQQSVYIKMMKTGFVICPSILDITLLNDEEQIDIFFSLFLPETMDPKTSTYIDNIKSKVKEVSGKLSIMTCEYLNESKTFFELANIDEKLQDEEYVRIEQQHSESGDSGPIITKSKLNLYLIYAYEISIVLALYIFCGIIHKDLHLGNIMIQENILQNSSELKNRVYLIDYGEIEDMNTKHNFNDRFKTFFEYSNKSLQIYFDKINMWIKRETRLSEIHVNVLKDKFTSFNFNFDDVLKNEVFKRELTRYCNELFSLEHIDINIQKKRTRRRFLELKIHKKIQSYSEKQKDVKTEKVLLNDFNNEVLSMVRGNVSFVPGQTEGGKRTQRRSKKHHKKTQRRKRSKK